MKMFCVGSFIHHVKETIIITRQKQKYTFPCVCFHTDWYDQQMNLNKLMPVVNVRLQEYTIQAKSILGLNNSIFRYSIIYISGYQIYRQICAYTYIYIFSMTKITNHDGKNDNMIIFFIKKNMFVHLFCFNLIIIIFRHLYILK